LSLAWRFLARAIVGRCHATKGFDERGNPCRIAFAQGRCGAAGKKMVPHWRGGRIRGFEEVFDKSRFHGLPADFAALDPIFQWTLHTASLALQGVATDLAAKQSKLFLANLGYPPREYVRFTEHTWFHDAPFLEQPEPHGKNRFSSGYPAFFDR